MPSYPLTPLQLFGSFFRLGLTTFGGGWGIVAQLERIYVQEKKLLSGQELLDITSVGRSLPGTMMGNVAFLFGHRLGGLMGGFAATVGVALPALLLLTLVVVFYDAVSASPLVLRIMPGIRAAVPAVILSAAWSLRKGAYPRAACYLVTAAAFVLVHFFGMSCVTLVLCAMAAGLLLCRLERKEDGPDGAA
ncbi:MAG: chromate transporter [Clostridia bacterium]|nr:chromate transporter [Clostridia bacterium]MBQ3077135.1 chromate transporter [Clostridia bacterium]